MSGDVDGATPRQFAAMLAAFPGVRRLEMIDCPGSLDEEANLILARAIRRAGLETVVPSGGSVRSGAVELWLAGSTRRASRDGFCLILPPQFVKLGGCRHPRLPCLTNRVR